MKLSIPSKALRNKRAAAVSDKWQAVFAWFPTRTTDETVEWLTTVSRRVWVEYPGTRGEARRKYKYGPASNALTQPGVDTGAGEQVFNPAVWSTGIASRMNAVNPFHRGVQNASQSLPNPSIGGAPLPGGLADVIGPVGEVVLDARTGTAYVRTAPGRYDTVVKEPGS